LPKHAGSNLLLVRTTPETGVVGLLRRRERTVGRRPASAIRIRQALTMAADQPEPELSNGEVVRRFYDGWNSGEIDFAALVAEDIVNHQPEVAPERGRSPFAAAVRGVMAAVPDSHWTIADLLVDGDRVAVRTTWTGTYGGAQFRGLAVAAAGSFSVEHIHIYRVVEQKLAEHWVVRDDLAMLRQLGALPS
jgi:predicted ester cyclase